MAVFVLSNIELDVLLSVAVDIGLSAGLDTDDLAVPVTKDTAGLFGKMLLTENIHSFAACHRFAESARISLHHEQVDAYEFTYVRGVRTEALAQLCSFVETQCVEHDGYRQSAARNFICAAREMLQGLGIDIGSRRIDALPWGVSDNKDLVAFLKPLGRRDTRPKIRFRM